MRRLPCTLGGLLLLFGATTAEAGRLFVIDTGVNLSGVVDGPDFTGGDGRDCHGHGTVMATITGVPASAITSVRALNCDGWGTDAWTVAAMMWVAANAVQGDAVLMAVGSAIWNNPDTTRDTIINASTDNGITWVVPAGNANDWAHFWVPGRIDKAIVVAGADGLYRWAASNFGPQVDLYADACAYGWCGTSVSAALVAGDVFALLTFYPWAPPAHISNLLITSCSSMMIDPGPGTTACKR